MHSASIQKLYVCLYSLHMRKLTALGLLFIYLSVNTELHQVFRLPVFFVHYYEHKNGNPDITLFNFITLHYFNGSVQHDDHDQELPFKTDHCTQISSSFVIPADDFFESTLNSLATAKNVVPSSQQFITSPFLFSIWQPPRA